MLAYLTDAQNYLNQFWAAEEKQCLLLLSEITNEVTNISLYERWVPLYIAIQVDGEDNGTMHLWRKHKITPTHGFKANFTIRKEERSIHLQSIVLSETKTN
ncbi:hypothetical protein PROFUN_12257 [Planoprotostelium fungivorum]|uniref:Uncharacterized protein n=1 Tax=Planoprotostelium fungivorum TaxID=1890364 RepID=A0A2P6N831_9EUKA|nr:hypothetical protein PROFUN_12257 [Planoprotostelium fungivorum]